MSNQTIVIGADGMDANLVEKWIDSGELPNLERVVESGTWGELNCTSLSSAQQWTTHFTGVGPETHGVTGFFRDDPAVISYDSELIDLTDVRSKTYPELLIESGNSIGLINPLIFWPPIEPAEGYCISGLLTPPEADGWVYPEDLKEFLLDSGYKIDVKYENRPYGFIDSELISELDLIDIKNDIDDVFNNRVRATKHLLSERKTDYCYVLLKSIDLYQHCFWQHMIEDDEEFGDIIKKCYKRVDDLVGWVQEKIPESNLLIMSDHGFRQSRTDAPETIDQIGKTVYQRVSVPNFLTRLYKAVFTNQVDVSDAAHTLTGEHGPSAVWLGSGPDIASVKKTDIEFEDLTPLILSLMNHPIPKSYAGTPPREAINKSINTEDIPLLINRDRDREENKAISERLYNLGYADMVDE